MRLINADKLIERINGTGYDEQIKSNLRFMVDMQSTIEERKKGKWIDAVMFGKLPVQVCDQCKTFYPLEYTGGGHNYCPNCGAKMESEDVNND